MTINRSTFSPEEFCDNAGTILRANGRYSAEAFRHARVIGIAVEALSPVRDSAWCDQMPREAYSVSRRRDVRRTEKIPAGDDCVTRRRVILGGRFCVTECRSYLIHTSSTPGIASIHPNAGYCRLPARVILGAEPRFLPPKRSCRVFV